jgi:chromosome segregation ATPase
MPTFWFYLKDLIPLLATIPLAVAAIWISNRWSKLRRGDAELQAKIAALRDEVDALRQEQAETHERLDYAERLLGGLREAHSELPKSSREVRERSRATPV